MSNNTTTIGQRARQRARESRIRAVHKTTSIGTRYYTVYNLKDHRRYAVTQYNGVWVCHCEAAKAQLRCKHIQRVMDREEKRTKREALHDVPH